MKIGLIGKGKTGSKIIELIEQDQSYSQHSLSVYSKSNPPTLLSLREVDVIICFIPGEEFLKICPMLFETNRPVVTGSTGVQFSDELNSKVKDLKLRWIHGTNFSLGMVVIERLLSELNRAKKLFNQHDVYLHEIHHTKKLDAPSGTALSMREWINSPEVVITHEREGDVVGTHQLKFDTPFESISIEHFAKNRTIFAIGALTAAGWLIDDHSKSISYGISKFSDIAKDKIK